MQLSKTRALEQKLTQDGTRFLTVKTLSDSHPDIHYQKTRKFYEAMGFYPLEEFTEIWGEANPCLFLIKVLSG